MITSIGAMPVTVLSTDPAARDMLQGCAEEKSEPYLFTAVLGLHNNGNNAIEKHLRTFHAGHVEPTDCRDRTGVVRAWEGNGTLHIESLRIWRHACPAEDFGLPSRVTSGTRRVRLACVICVRDPVTWLVSMSRKPYDTYPTTGKKRAHGKLDWLLGNITFRGSTAPAIGQVDREFSDALVLWEVWYAHYLRQSFSRRESLPVFVPALEKNS